jgi:hypothetical protein
MSLVPQEINNVINLLNSIKGNTNTVRLIKEQLDLLSTKYEKHIMFLVN